MIYWGKIQICLRGKQMKKIIIIIFFLCALIVTSCFIVGSNTDNDISNILKLDMSTFEQSEEINKMIEVKLSDCEKIKNDIIVLINDLHNESEIYGTYFSEEKVLGSFDLYYEKSLDKIKSQTDFDEYRSVLKYSSGSEASLEILSLKYDYVSGFYKELKEVLLYLQELRKE